MQKVWETVVDFGICHRTVSLRKLYYVTLTYFVNVKNKKVICEIVRASAKKVWESLIHFDIFHRMLSLLKLYSVTFLISECQLFKMLIYLKP